MNTFLFVRMRSSAWKVVILLLVAAVLVCSTVLMSVGSALAGSNGQMLRLANACPNPAMLTWVKVTGKNQSGVVTTWEARPNSAGVQTNGYWWVGGVNIDWRTNRDSYLHRTYDVVPKSFQRDWWGVILDKWGC